MPLLINDEFCYDEYDPDDETDEERFKREQLILEQNWGEEEQTRINREIDELNLEYGAR